MRKWRHIVWIAPIMMAILIFAFSATPGEESTEMSRPLTLHLVQNAKGILHAEWSDAKMEEMAQYYELYVRKGAHMLVYAILGMTVIHAMFISFSMSKKNFLISWIICIDYALTDEFHQHFVEGRSGRFLDVGFDSVGALIGLLLFTGLFALVHRKKG